MASPIIDEQTQLILKVLLIPCLDRRCSSEADCITENSIILFVYSLTIDGVFAPVNHTYPVLTIEPVSTSVFKEQNCGLSYISSQEGL